MISKLCSFIGQNNRNGGLRYIYTYKRRNQHTDKQADRWVDGQTGWTDCHYLSCFSQINTLTKLMNMNYKLIILWHTSMFYFICWSCLSLRIPTTSAVNLFFKVEEKKSWILTHKSVWNCSFFIYFYSQKTIHTI